MPARRITATGADLDAVEPAIIAAFEANRTAYIVGGDDDRDALESFLIATRNTLERQLGIADDIDGPVSVNLGSGTVHVGFVQVDHEEADDDGGLALRKAAVAWNALTRNGVFRVGAHEFSATECAEWWA